MSQLVPFQVYFPENSIIFSEKHTLKIQLGTILQYPFQHFESYSKNVALFFRFDLVYSLIEHNQEIG